MDTEAIETRLNALFDKLSELTRSLNEFIQRRDQGSFMAADGHDEEHVVAQKLKPSLPDARLIRQIIRQRQLRARYFDAELFADPAWDILLDLAAARAENARISVTSLCIASGVPATTALRWISQLVEMGLLKRVEDETDRRRAFIELTERSADSIARYFLEAGYDPKIFY